MNTAIMNHSEDTNQRLWHQLDRVHGLARRHAHLQDGPRMARGRDGSRGQGRVLKALALVPEATQKDLVGLLDMRQQSLAEVIAKLEAKGLVKREEDPEDRRRHRLSLTEAGRAAAEEVGEPSDGTSPFDCLTDEEKATLENLLARVGESLAVEVASADEDRARRSREKHHGRRHGDEARGCGEGKRKEKGEGKREGKKKGRDHGPDEESRKGHGKGHGQGRGEEARKGRRGGHGGGSAERVHKRVPLINEVGAEEEAAAFTCNHQCRTCPLRAQGTCIKHR